MYRPTVWPMHNWINWGPYANNNNGIKWLITVTYNERLEGVNNEEGGSPVESDGEGTGRLSDDQWEHLTY